MRSRHRRLRYELLETRDLLTTVQISDELVGHHDSRVTVPVNVDDATGIRAAEIRIEYDAAQLVVQPKDVVAGAAWAGTAVAMTNVDERAGVITVFVFSTTSLAGGSGSLVDVSFTINRDVQATKTAIDLAEVRLNEGQIELTATPIPGADPTDGTITITRVNDSQLGKSMQSDLRRVCVVNQQNLSQESFVQPLPPLAPPHLIRSTLADKPARLPHGRGFIGPVEDLVFARTHDWLRVR